MSDTVVPLLTYEGREALRDLLQKQNLWRITPLGFLDQQGNPVFDEAALLALRGFCPTQPPQPQPKEGVFNPS